MSETSTTSKPEQGPAGGAAPEAGLFSTLPIDEYRKRILSQIAELGTHVEGLQHRLSDAAAQARVAIEKELESIKTQHPEAFARISELRTTSDESLDALRSRLDKLAGDMERAVSGILTTLTEQAKRAGRPPAPAPQNAPSAEPASTETPPSTDKP